MDKITLICQTLTIVTTCLLVLSGCSFLKNLETKLLSNDSNSETTNTQVASTPPVRTAPYWDGQTVFRRQPQLEK